jgi:CheY-like chemotaxis protein
LKQVLINLIGNAIKFTASGTVLLRIDASEPSDPALAPAISFLVSDTGIGISPEHTERIFDGFCQADATTSRKYGGTGLGLAISQRLVRLMGGDIALDSLHGSGSSFRFSLALAPRGLPAILAPSKKIRALVVDDNPTAGQALVDTCQGLGWECLFARDARHALGALNDARSEGRPFDVAAIDSAMPGIDGWTCAASIRSLTDADARRPAILMLAPFGAEPPASPSGHFPFDAQLSKPATASMLEEARLAAGGRPSSEIGDKLPAPRLAGLRILVVEDNGLNQQIAEELLSAEGAWVELASDGHLGVLAVAQAAVPFDIVLMDIQMPTLDGLSAARAIRSEPKFSRLPILAMTANALESDRADSLAAGMDGHVNKPFELDDLILAIRAAIESARRP